MNKRQHKKWIKKQFKIFWPMVVKSMWGALDTPDVKWLSLIDHIRLHDTQHHTE